ncbi:hypothetical protein HY311_03400 [Candidatus Nomurabacteria bacterium]|nr:hypothetical protein [Candidatus Nomurabacteria bacterium]
MSTCNPGILSVLCKINEIFGAVIPVLVALGVVYLVWGIVQYMIGDSEEAKKKGKDGIIYGIIGLTVIISVWGLVFILVNTFNLDDNNYINNSDLNKLLPK